MKYTLINIAGGCLIILAYWSDIYIVKLTSLLLGGIILGIIGSMLDRKEKK